MPFMPLITAGIGGVFSGIGNSKSRTTTGTQNQSSTNTAELDPKQTRINRQLFNQIIAALKMGPTVSDSDRNVARKQTNDSYDAANANLQSNLASRGYGESGKMGTGFRNNSIARANSFQTTEAVLRDQAQSRWQQMIQNAFPFNTPRTTTSTGSGTSSQTQPGTPWQSSVGGGLSDLASLLFMNQMGGGMFGGGLSNAGASGITTGLSSIPWCGCWVAQELYGDWRVLLVRSHIAQRAETSWLWFAFSKLYSVFGQQIAELIRTDMQMRRVFKRLFDRLVMKALAA
jgi:hypothetical protein